GKGKKARIARLIEEIPATAKGEQAEDRYMLMAALYLAGDRRYEAELKKVDASPIAVDRINSWSFYSDRRRRAFQLSTFHDLFGNDAAGEALATRVAESLSGQKSGYYNTQELVWGVTGLGKWVQGMNAKGVADGKLVADGVTIDARKAKRKTNDKSWSLLRASEYAKLSLEIPASAAGMWLGISSEGIRPGGAYQGGGNGMTVRRTFYGGAGGNELVDVGSGALKLGDLLYVELDVANTSGDVIQNVALVDRLPAGLEIENPRLGRSMKADWFEPGQLWASDFLNMRDDRLEVFGTLQPSESKKVIYTVRVVTAGKFTIPPVEVEAMYDPTLWARAVAPTPFVVSGPWTGKTI
ncbi:MAG: hypothetical protein NT062_27975, partial [Proteobacteria bacterium]|nr:hypothetical protein [Pseudomonadota bacterium]